MPNLFFGLNIGRSALLSSQAALNVTGHNLANVQTEGYSRQRVEMTPSLPVQDQRHTYGSGVTIDSVERIHSAWVERQLNRMQGQNGYDRTMKQGLDEVQAMLGEPSSDGIGSALSDFWNSWDALSLQPGDSGLRAQVLNQAQNLATMFNQRVGALREAEDRFDQTVADSLAQVNTMLREFAELNATVAGAEATNRPANDVADRRDLLVTRIAEKIGVEVEADGAYLNLRLPDGGPYVVSHDHAFEITRGVNADGNIADFRIQGGPPAALPGGEIGALLTLRDEVSTGVRQDLTGWLVTVTDRVNELHTSGYDRDGNAGRNLFSWSGQWDSVALAASSGVQQVDASATLQAGTHRLDVTAVTGVTNNANGNLTAGASVTLSVTNVGPPAFDSVYTGPRSLNLDYHLRVVGGNTAAGIVDGAQVQLFRGDEAVGDVRTLGGGGSGDTASWSVDGLTIEAVVDVGAASLQAGNRSDGLSTVGEASLDGGLPPVAVDLTVSTSYTFVGGAASGFLAGGTVRAAFDGAAFDGATFTLYGDDSALSVDAAVVRDVDLVAASADPDAPLNGDLARQLANLATQRIHENTHETPAYMLGRIVQELGAKGQEAAVFDDSSSSILLQLQTQREGISGVNVDEEMVLMIQYQRGFEAAARFLNTVDGLLDQLINGMGR